MRARAALLLLALALAAVVGAGCGGEATPTIGQQRSDESGSLPGEGRPVITLGTRTSLEHILLGQLYKQALEAQGYRVRLKQNIGSTWIADAALRSGEIDAYPEYLGQWMRAVAHEDTRFADVQGALAVARGHAASRGFSLLEPTPYQHVEAVAVTPRLAREHELSSIGDLRAVPDLRLGAAPELYDDPAGLPGLERVYGIGQVAYAPLTDGLQYAALDEGRLDAAIVGMTDGELADGERVLLEDPLNLFGVEPVVPVLALRTLVTSGPGLARTLNAVSAALSTEAMQELNAATRIDRRPPQDVARDFLHEHDLA